MENKVLVNLEIPEINYSFNTFLPVNEIIWKIKKMLAKSITDIINNNLSSNDYLLINKSTGAVYKNNDIIINTDIRNTTELLLFSKNSSFSNNIDKK